MASQIYSSLPNSLIIPVWNTSFMTSRESIFNKKLSEELCRNITDEDCPCNFCDKGILKSLDKEADDLGLHRNNYNVLNICLSGTDSNTYKIKGGNILLENKDHPFAKTLLEELSSEEDKKLKTSRWTNFLETKKIDKRSVEVFYESSSHLTYFKKYRSLNQGQMQNITVYIKSEGVYTSEVSFKIRYPTGSKIEESILLGSYGSISIYARSENAKEKLLKSNTKCSIPIIIGENGECLNCNDCMSKKCEDCEDCKNCEGRKYKVIKYVSTLKNICVPHRDINFRPFESNNLSPKYKILMQHDFESDKKIALLDSIEILSIDINVHRMCYESICINSQSKLSKNFVKSIVSLPEKCNDKVLEFSQKVIYKYVECDKKNIPPGISMIRLKSALSLFLLSKLPGLDKDSVDYSANLREVVSFHDKLNKKIICNDLDNKRSLPDSNPLFSYKIILPNNKSGPIQIVFTKSINKNCPTIEYKNNDDINEMDITSYIVMLFIESSTGGIKDYLAEGKECENSTSDIIFLGINSGYMKVDMKLVYMTEKKDSDCLDIIITSSNSTTTLVTDVLCERSLNIISQKVEFLAYDENNLFSVRMKILGSVSIVLIGIEFSFEFSDCNIFSDFMGM